MIIETTKDFDDERDQYLSDFKNEDWLKDSNISDNSHNSHLSS